MGEWFHRLAGHASRLLGSHWAFVIAVLVIICWAITGPFFHFSDTWQLVINTGTTIITFLMVFVIQNSQNRDTRALHLKLDELIHVIKGARNRLVHAEHMTEAELKKLEHSFDVIEEAEAKGTNEPPHRRQAGTR
jgi:low affinity Fe/Cu permease